MKSVNKNQKNSEQLRYNKYPHNNTTLNIPTKSVVKIQFKYLPSYYKIKSIPFNYISITFISTSSFIKSLHHFLIYSQINTSTYKYSTPTLHLQKIYFKSCISIFQYIYHYHTLKYLMSQKIVSPNPTHQEKHIQSGQFLKSAVYGGLDGMVNTLSVIVGGVGAGTKPLNIMAIGVSVLIGDGIGMGLGDYLSTKSEIEYIKAQQDRELWEVRNKLDDQKKQMQDVYIEKGYSIQQSKKLSDLVSHNHEAFVNIMMLEQLGLAVQEGNPMINGVVNFLSFVIFGFFPLLPYIIYKIHPFKENSLVISSVIIGIFFFSLLGFTKAWLVGGRKIFSAALTLALGGSAVAVGYAVGLGLKI